MTPAADVERAQAVRRAAKEASGLYVELEHLRALAEHVERFQRGDRSASIELLGYVESLLDRWRRSL